MSVTSPTTGRVTSRSVPATAPAAGTGRLALAAGRPGFVLTFIGAHVVLGAAMHLSSGVATLHALVAVALALGLTLFGRDVLAATAAVVYVGAADVLWRATGAKFFYEGPKYVVAFCLMILLVQRIRAVSSLLPGLYVVLLLPSVALTVLAFGGGAREPISFNLSGPLALGVSALFFQQVRLRWPELRLLLLGAIGSLTGLAANTLLGILTATELTFGTESNYQTSGGFGPNQVSLTLGFGGLACLVILMRERQPVLRLIAGAMGVWFLGQSAFTFSRGGTLTLLVAGSLLVVLHLRDRIARRRIPVLLVFGLLVGVFTFTRLDAVTGGALDKRFSDTGTTNRTNIAADDLELFRSHALTGVGPGMAKFSRSGVQAEVAHTEFTRLVAEHGIFGIAALAMLILALVRAVAIRTTMADRALVVGFGSWSLISMSHAAMRVALISVAFGLALALPPRTTPDAGPATD